MPRPRKSVPAYRLHRPTGQAVVTLTDGTGGRRNVYLGQYGSSESQAEYTRVLGEWRANGGRPPAQQGSAPDLSVNELALAYWKFAQEYYGFGRRRGTSFNVKDALGVLKQLYGLTRAADFGPLALKACRAEMLKRDWSRTYINAQVDKLRRVFKWAASEQLVPVTVYQGLRTVEPLRHGRTEARETKKVRPVSAEHVEATLAHMPATVRAMVRLQLLTGCRPDEVCRLRPLDLDMTAPACWVYRPGPDQGPEGKHKTAHHGHERLILIGPRAQEILRPYLGTKLDGYCFDPQAAERQRSQDRRAARQTPLTPSQKARRPRGNRKRAPQGRHQVTSYRNAIYRACDRAFPLPEALGPRPSGEGKREGRKAWWGRLTAEERQQVRAWRREHRWHHNRLCHSRATELRPFGLDVVKTILGHSKVETTQIYSEKDLAAAMEVVARIG
jgi:integrase